MSADRLYDRVDINVAGHEPDVTTQVSLRVHKLDQHYKANMDAIRKLNGGHIVSLHIVPAANPFLGEWKALVAEGHTTLGFNEWLLQRK